MRRIGNNLGGKKKDVENNCVHSCARKYANPKNKRSQTKVVEEDELEDLEHRGGNEIDKKNKNY